MNDNLKTQEYISWCEKWTDECVRLLKPGGSLFVWNLPKWNSYMASYLNNRLTFRHWISCDIKFSLPIQGRLYPSHYSLLYYCKGEKPTTFKPDRLQMPICPHCCGDLKDYGGYKHKMNPKGINLTDVWLDIPPVRHAKYKKRVGANELSVKLLDRVIATKGVSP
ncbi:MAG: DNA methyltransferase [Kiritimatiellae bacterium]|nr:DNA methyltransferase [Kiritimatiellia bacterium]